MQATPVIWYYDRVSSSLDVAYTLAKNGRLSCWDSVFAAEQHAGRGQLRRNWISPRGNIYASLRLPAESPFTGDFAAPAFGTLLAYAFLAQDIPVRVKWPNDLLLPGKAPGEYAKVGGILLEERGGVLIAGVGINVVSSPAEACLREEHRFSAISLKEALGHTVQAQKFWQTLVLHIITVYKERENFSFLWESLLAPLLVDAGKRASH